MEYIEERYDRLLLIYEVHFELIDHDLISLSSPYFDPFAQVHENIQLNVEYQLIDPKKSFEIFLIVFLNIHKFVWQFENKQLQ